MAFGAPRRCIVIGAGLSGLAAAHRLTKQGWVVDVFEGQQRLGGRVMSHRFNEAPDLVCELGAEWIGNDHLAMKRLAAEFALALEEHRYSFSFWDGASTSKRYEPGEWCYSQDARQRFEAFAREYRDYDDAQLKQLDLLDWWTQLRLIGFSPAELLRRDLADSTDFGESIRQVSAYVAASAYIDGNATDEVDWKIAGGNSRLIDALASSIGRDRIHTGAKVTAVRQAHGEVTVVLADGRKQSADACICTVPAQGLGRIAFSPPLSREQQDAANQLQYSRITKTAVLYGERFWKAPRGSGFSVLTSRASDYCFDSTHGQPGPPGILSSYAIGEKADDLAAEPDQGKLATWITGDVESAVGNAGAKAVSMKTMPWQGEDWVGGAYALFRPGQWFRLRPLLQQPHGLVHFAGEHLADQQGFMEGAVVSGEAAAGALLPRRNRAL